jgi:hypothetical protein
MSALADVTPRKSYHVLIVQLGEIEEVFRSLMAARAVQQLYPESRFHFIVRSGHSTPVSKVDWIETVQEIPTLSPTDEPLKAVALWTNGIIEQHYDILCNWTYSKKHLRMSSILTTLIPAAVKYGHHLRDDFTVTGLDGWTIYREAWLRDSAIDQDIHHTDIITTQLLTAMQIHSGSPTAGSSAGFVTSRFFFKNNTKISFPKSSEKWVAIHPDSLNSRIDEVIEMILRRHPDHGVVILNDTRVGEESGIDSNNPRILNLSGSLEFETLVSALNGCSWLIAGCSPIVALANLLNVRILYWIEAHPQITGESHNKWTETGPYGNGNIAIRFNQDFQPEVFYAVWSYYQGEWIHQGEIQFQNHFENLGLTSSLSQIEVYKSRIRSSSEGGGVSFESVIHVDPEFENWMYRLRGQLARAWFCGWIPPIEEEVEKLKLTPNLIRHARELKESIQVIERVCVEAKKVSQDLQKVSSTIRNPRIMSIEDRDSIETCAKKLLELESLIARVVQVEKELRCFHVWYQQLMHHLDGETIEKMAIETDQAFDLMMNGANLICSYIEKVLKKAKPKAVTLLASEEVTPLKEN